MLRSLSLKWCIKSNKYSNTEILKKYFILKAAEQVAITCCKSFMSCWSNPAFKTLLGLVSPKIGNWSLNWPLENPTAHSSQFRQQKFCFRLFSKFSNFTYQILFYCFELNSYRETLTRGTAQHFGQTLPLLLF